MPSATCPNCGHVNRQSARFCAACGAQLLSLTEVAAAAPAMGKPAPEAWHLPLLDLLLLTICSLAAAFLLGLALPILNLSGHLDDAELYKAALRQENVYQRFPDLFAAQMALSQNALGKEAQIDFRGFTADDWKLIAQELITPQWVQVQVEHLIDEIFASIQNRSTTPRLTISLAEVMQKLGGEAGFRIYKQVISTKRPCKLDDFFSMMDWLDEDPQATLPICYIPPSLVEFAAFFTDYENGDALIRDLIRELPAQIPQELALSDFFTLPLDQVGAVLRLLRVVGWLCLGLAPLTLLFTFLARSGRRLPGWLISWGVALALGGLLGLAAGFLSPRLLRSLITSNLRGVLTDALSGVTLAISQTVLAPGVKHLTWQAGGLLLFGLLMSGLGGLFGLVRR